MTHTRQQDPVLFYDRFSEHFDDAMNGYDVRKRIRIVFSDLLPTPLQGRKILDAGCGTGWFSRAAMERGADFVVSLDIGMNLLKMTDRKCRSRKVCSDVLHLPFPAGSFDIVICSEVIEHTPEPGAAFRELARVLKRGGILVLTVPNRFWHWAVRFANRFRLRPYEGLENWCRRQDIRAWCGEHRIAIEKLYGFHLYPYVLPFTHGMLDYFDRFGDRLGPVMLNIALKGSKR